MCMFCSHTQTQKFHSILWVVETTVGNNDIFVCYNFKFTPYEAQICHNYGEKAACQLMAFPYYTHTWLCKPVEVMVLKCFSKVAKRLSSAFDHRSASHTQVGKQTSRHALWNKNALFLPGLAGALSPLSPYLQWFDSTNAHVGLSLYSYPFQSTAIVLWSLFWLAVHMCNTGPLWSIVRHSKWMEAHHFCAALCWQRGNNTWWFGKTIECVGMRCWTASLASWRHRGPRCGQPFSACHYWWQKDVSKGVKWDRTAVNAGAQAWNMIRPPCWIEVLSCQKCERGGGRKRLSGIAFISCHPLSWQCRRCVLPTASEA